MPALATRGFFSLTNGSSEWAWHEHRYGVVFEVLFDSDEQWEAFRALPAVRSALDGAPDPEALAVASYGEEAKLHLDRALSLLEAEDLPPSPDAAARFAEGIASAVSLSPV